MEDFRSCLFCDKKLTPATPKGWGTMQPYAGGEVQFLFCYGSTKFDNCCGITKFKALICDECAEKYVEKMEEIRS